MKKLLEYINLIENTEDWKSVVAREVEARGIPVIGCIAEYIKEIPVSLDLTDSKNSGTEEINFFFSTDNVGTMISDEDGEISDISDVELCVTELCSTADLLKADLTFGLTFDDVLRRTDEWLDDIKLTSNSQTSRINEEELDQILSQFGTDLDSLRSGDRVPGISGGFDWDDPEYPKIHVNNNCFLKWSGLEISLEGPNIRITEVKGELTEKPESKQPQQPELEPTELNESVDRIKYLTDYIKNK
jgi:hypothetical protein